MALRDTGGRKGRLLRRPDFDGAITTADLKSVLSEGEQTAIGLPGLFTAAHFDETRSALVFDDPIGSLDHTRRGLVGQSLAQTRRWLCRLRGAQGEGTPIAA